MKLIFIGAILFMLIFAGCVQQTKPTSASEQQIQQPVSGTEPGITPTTDTTPSTSDTLPLDEKELEIEEDIFEDDLDDAIGDLEALDGFA